jgi:hypothetical protein
MGSGLVASVLEFGAFDKAEPSRWAQDGGRPAETDVLAREIANLPVIRTRLSRRLARTHDARTLHTVDAKGGDCGSLIIREMSAKRSRGMATSAIWKTT